MGEALAIGQPLAAPAESLVIYLSPLMQLRLALGSEALSDCAE